MVRTTKTLLIILRNLINSKRPAAKFDFITPTVWRHYDSLPIQTRNVVASR